MPAHAQRMSSLLAADKEGVFCRDERRARMMRGELRAGEAGDRGAGNVRERVRL